MNDFVPDFELDEEFSVPTSSSSINKLKAKNMELRWQDGHVFSHSQPHKSPPSKPPQNSPPPLISPPQQAASNQLYIEEDEMANWLHYSFDDLCPDLLPPSPPPPPPPPQPTVDPPKNFQMFSRMSGRASTSKVEEDGRDKGGGGGGGAAVKEVENRKRKECYYESMNEGVEHESASEKKQHSRASTTSTKRSRAAEVHNLSERRRRDKINEKMKALQELIPRCNKADKASMLEEAIEYLKSLQMQVQMMSMGCGMIPMMYPGMQQQFMPLMAMGMGIDMGMTYPAAFSYPGSSMPTNPTASASAAPKLPAPAFPMPAIPAPCLPVMQGRNQADSINSTCPPPNSGSHHHPNMADNYQQFIAFQQMQMQMQLQMQMQMQSQSYLQPGSSRPSTSKSNEGQDNNQFG